MPIAAVFVFQIAVVFLLAGAFFVLSSLYERRKLRRFLERGCAGFRWRRRFSQASKSEIREFLNIFVEAFAYRQQWRTYFAPDDQVMEFYRIRYQFLGGPDDMELDDFVEQLQKRYGIDVVSSWREDITLGDLFAKIRRAAA